MLKYVDKEIVKQERDTLKKEYYDSLRKVIDRCEEENDRVFIYDQTGEKHLSIETNKIDRINGASFYENEAGQWRSRTEYINTLDEEILSSIKYENEMFEYINSDEYKEEYNKFWSEEEKPKRKWYQIF